MPRRRLLVSVILAVLAMTAAACASAAAASVRLTTVGGTFDRPVDVAAPPNDAHRVFVVEQAGRIWALRDGTRLPTPFLDLTAQVSRVESERGLLSLAFAPDYERSGRFYVDYTDRRGGTIKVVEFRRSADPDRADPASARVVLSQVHHDRRHNGGLLLFGPDRLLYVGVGDGGGANDRHATGATDRTLERSSARSCASTLARARRAPTRSLSATRSRTGAEHAGKSTHTGCAIPGASPSIVLPAIWQSGTSDRTTPRSSTSLVAAGRGESTSAGVRSRAGSASIRMSRPSGPCIRC